MSTILIELRGGAGVVRRDDGEIVLTHDVGDDRGRPLHDGDRYLPLKIWLHEDRSLVGGLLPPGAVTVEVVEDSGARVTAVASDGVYAAVLAQANDGNEPVVCCRDAHGTPVRRPLPADYPCVRVQDAEEPCPSCGAVDYEECVPTEDWRGGWSGPDGSIIPSPIVVCRVCGHQEQMGSLTRASESEEEDETAKTKRIAQWRADQRVQQWYSDTLTLRALTFPIYAVEGWPAQVAGSSSQNDELTELTIAHTVSEDADLLDERPRIEVTTARTHGPHQQPLAIARERLEQWIHEEIVGDDSPDLSNAGITLWFRGVDRRRRAAALAAAHAIAQITVDGAPAPFLILSTASGRWVAVRRHDNLLITIAARDLDPATIFVEPVADPAARLLGPEPPQQ